VNFCEVSLERELSLRRRVASGGVVAQGVGGLVAQPALALGHSLASSDFTVLRQSVGERLGWSLFKK
jgi:hypothetical protein